MDELRSIPDELVNILTKHDPSHGEYHARFGNGVFRNHELAIIDVDNIAKKNGIEVIEGKNFSLYLTQEGIRFLAEVTPETLESLNNAILRLTGNIDFIRKYFEQSIKFADLINFEGGSIEIVEAGGQSLVLKVELDLKSGETKTLAIKLPKKIFYKSADVDVSPPIEMLRRRVMVNLFKEGYKPKNKTTSIYSEIPPCPQQEDFATINVPLYCTDQYAVEEWREGHHPASQDEKSNIDAYSRRINAILSSISGSEVDENDFWLKRLFEGVLLDGERGVIENFINGSSNLRAKDINWIVDKNGKYHCIDVFNLEYRNMDQSEIEKAVMASLNTISEVTEPYKR